MNRENNKILAKFAKDKGLKDNRALNSINKDVLEAIHNLIMDNGKNKPKISPSSIIYVSGVYTEPSKLEKAMK